MDQYIHYQRSMKHLLVYTHNLQIKGIGLLVLNEPLFFFVKVFSETFHEVFVSFTLFILDFFDFEFIFFFIIIFFLIFVWLLFVEYSFYTSEFNLFSIVSNSNKLLTELMNFHQTNDVTIYIKITSVFELVIEGNETSFVDIAYSQILHHEANNMFDF